MRKQSTSANCSVNYSTVSPVAGTTFNIHPVATSTSHTITNKSLNQVHVGSNNILPSSLPIVFTSSSTANISDVHCISDSTIYSPGQG